MAGDPHIVLVGMMGSGKSTLGRELAARLGRPHADGDEILGRRIGRSGRDLAMQEGVDELHRLEAEILLELLADSSPTIVSAAASVVEDPRCREALAGPFVCWLRLPVEALRSRMDAGHHRRTVTVAELAELDRRREPLFAAVANLELDARLPTGSLASTVIAVLPDR